MRTSSKRTLRPVSVASAALGLLLVGIAATPAHAQSVRARQWYLDAMQADEMWETSTGKGITVAVIDSGVDTSLADLEGQVLDGKDYSDQRGDAHTDLAGHGTNMAALIAATGARGSLDGSYGLAPGSKILPIRMRYSTEDFGKVDTGSEYSRVMSEAIRYAADSKAQIINISMAAANASGRKNVGTPELASAVRYAIDQGKLIFAGVGNSGDTSNLPQYPASTPGVVGVGAVTESVQRASFSQHGSEVDVTAPGDNMIHACLGGTQVCRTEGTSDATAIASASAALIWSKHPSWTNNQVLRVLINTMKGNEKSWTRNDDFGYGIVRPRAALEDPGDPGPADTYPLPDLAAATSASPAPKPSQATNSASDDKTGDSTASEADDSNAPLRIALGFGVAALLGTAVAVPVIRARRRRVARSAAVPVPPAYSPYVSHQPYPPFGQPQGQVPGSPTDGSSGTDRPSAR
ncbi:type VII secretion-associated serine protease mycosin [Streptomyces griseoruber]|uniref:Type VII secretion-associated serine protease mycosin n=1 Tax=Streptomyces griseoruber TaxID=1943 RepID=A0A101SSH5_9ACTN|nr:type VII secretion-associated serine protease mycosin [Streptomyces griseoruber]KUN79389.1 type VII secretion-associated serine protease mycosin [Streptomyces griseoruber]